jgi:hypothetical protein
LDDSNAASPSTAIKGAWVVAAVMQRRRGTRQQRGEPRLALDQRPRAHAPAVKMQKIEDEIDQLGALPASDAAWVAL